MGPEQEVSRRNFLSQVSTAMVSVPIVAACGGKNRQETVAASPQSDPAPLTTPTNGVISPGIENLAFKMDGDVKVFSLTAEEVTIYFPDGSDPSGQARRPIRAWGYNGSVIGPTIEATEGDKVRIVVTNHLSEPTTVHWHGLHLPIAMDGVSGISQEPIAPGEEFVYEFQLMQHGTYFYHPHFMAAKQAGLGMVGFFIVHPRAPSSDYEVDRDYAYFLQTWMIQPGSPIPDTMEMSNFNYFTMNGRVAPDITPMAAKIGERVRIRVANLSMLTHPIHIHGHTFRIAEYGAGFLPRSQQIIANTTNVSSAEVRTLEFTAGPNPGKWLFHCHFLHHVMNDMHRTPIPGSRSGHAAHEVGGMHTWIEVT